MYEHLRRGDTFKCDRCRAVYVVVDGEIEERNEARCACCGVVMMGWPKHFGFELVREPPDQWA